MVSFSKILLLVAAGLSVNVSNARTLRRGEPEEETNQGDYPLRDRRDRKPNIFSAAKVISGALRPISSERDTDERKNLRPPGEERKCPTSDNLCIAIFDPVTCYYEGIQCPYSSQACADAAYDSFAKCTKTIDPISGGRKTSCPQDGGLCTKEFDPYLCEYQGVLCSYTNLCVALSNVGPETKCIRVRVDEPNTPPDESNTLPVSKVICPRNDDVRCTYEYDPYTCEYQGIQCPYTNLCTALETLGPGVRCDPM